MAAVLTLGVLGIILIWKGFTGNVITTRMGDPVIPRWAYILGGIVMLAFPVVAILAQTDSGKEWLGF